MKNAKKLLALLLAAVMVLSVFAIQKFYLELNTVYGILKMNLHLEELYWI